MDNELFSKALELGVVGVFAIVMYIVYKMIASYNTIQAEMLKGQEASHSRLIRIMDDRDESNRLKIDLEKEARMVLEHRLNEQKDEQEKLKEQIKMLLDEIKDKEIKIANLILQLKERDDKLAQTQRELADVREKMKREIDEVRDRLQKELDEVRAERDELKKRLSAVEAQQKDGVVKDKRKPNGK